MHIILSFLLSICALAQHSEQPKKESDTDLRTAMILFSIEDRRSEKTIQLERTPNLDHFIRFKEDKKDEVIFKIGSKEAKNLEMDFASRYLKCQYELEEVPGECKVSLRLYLKGDRQEICNKDERKGQEIAPFIKALNKRF